MLATLAFLFLMQQSPVRATRASFTHALNKVKVDWTQDQVRRLLGPPDDVWPANDSSNYVNVGDEAWCYGTNGHHTLPTLGYIRFREKKVLTIAGQGEPPPADVISDAEITQALRAMWRPPQRVVFGDTDSQRLIQVSNLLIPKGRQKALAVLREFGRIGEGSDWLFWLVRVMFASKRPGGVFPVPAIGAIAPEPPNDLKKWPTFPVLIVDHIPICLFRGADLGGFPEPFDWYMREHEKEWTLKTKVLVPPDDPFPSYKKLIASNAWPFPRGKREPYDDNEGQALREILGLVRTAYRPQETSELDYDRFHRAFLAVGGHWDVARQMYVQKDGTVLNDRIDDYPQAVYRFKGVPRMDVTITFSRGDDSHIQFDIACKEHGSGRLGSALVVAEDAATHEEFSWVSINDSQPAEPWRTSKEKALAIPPHKPSSNERHIGSGFVVPKGRSVRFVVFFGKQRYTSPVFKP